MISSPPGTEMFQFPGLPPRCLCVQQRVSRYQPGGVAPFGHPRITACWQLPAAYRSHPRPSSALGAKASTVRPCSLGIPIARSRPLPSRQDLARSSASINNGCRLSPLTHLHYSAVVQVRHLRLIACRRAHRPYWSVQPTTTGQPCRPNPERQKCGSPWALPGRTAEVHHHLDGHARELLLAASSCCLLCLYLLQLPRRTGYSRFSSGLSMYSRRGGRSLD